MINYIFQSNPCLETTNAPSIPRFHIEDSDIKDKELTYKKKLEYLRKGLDKGDWEFAWL